MWNAPLHQGFNESARRDPDRVAVIDPGRGALNYGEMAALADQVCAHLRAQGIGRGDRVGVFMRKSAETVAVILGVLKAGAAYVPVDAGAPAVRGAFILNDCGVRAVYVDADLAGRLGAELAALGEPTAVWAIERGGFPGHGLRQAAASWRALASATRSAGAEAEEPGPDELAYILYTSGSTGRPKGVMLSHRNAVSFVDWCSETFAPTADDRISSHAPFHFDLSILDLYLCFKHGATLVLVTEDIGKDAPRLARLIADERISIWYSAPSILSLLAQFGDLAAYPAAALRQVLFAGEVFPVKHLRRLGELWPQPRYFNLYGPTETNVCTWHEVPMPVPAERSTPYPIGSVCSHLQGRVLDEQGHEVARGDEGELCIAGAGVMGGYWGMPERTAAAFWQSADARNWYRTGDIVVEDDKGCHTYRGRRDRMVKRRGYRVELGEIEAALYRHSGLAEAAVVAHADEEAGISIVAFVAARGGKPLSLIEMKRFCSEQLPLYMIPDRFRWLDSLPKTSTDKVDYQQLKALG